jgi:hypothetical protein
MSVSLELQGGVTTDDLAKEGQMKTEEQEAAKEMDLVIPLPVETTLPSRDIKDDPAPSVKTSKAEKANEETQSAIREASPKKAKTRQVRKRKNTEPMPKEGTPTPDYLKQLQDQYTKMEDLYRNTYQLYENMNRVQASQTPMQAYGVPSESTKRQVREAPNHTNTYQEYDPREDLKRIPLHNNPRSQEYYERHAPRQQPNIEVHEAELYRRRNKEALEAIVYDTESTMRNRAQNSVSQTGPPPSHSAGGSGHWYDRW